MVSTNINEPFKADETVPFLAIKPLSSDKVEEYRQGIDRLDKISQKYYGNPYFGKLILMANPEYVFEFDIEDGGLLRIPFPLEVVLENYNQKIKEYQEL